MYRSPWELAIYVRHHTADLVNEHRTCSPVTRTDDRPANLLTPLRHRVGVSLIKAGHALAGYDAVRVLPTPPARPAT